MSTTSSDVNPGDQSSSRSKALPRRAKAPVAVPDDWENADSDSEPDNEKIWADANTQAARMPTVIMSQPSSNGPPPPPLKALQAPMRILKRPSASPSPSSSSNTSTAQSLQEREAQYQAARTRIFGSGTSLERKKDGTSSPKESFATVKVMREPLGPTETADEETLTPKGFNRRKPAS